MWESGEEPYQTTKFEVNLVVWAVGLSLSIAHDHHHSSAENCNNKEGGIGGGVIGFVCGSDLPCVCWRRGGRGRWTAIYILNNNNNNNTIDSVWAKYRLGRVREQGWRHSATLLRGV